MTLEHHSQKQFLSMLRQTMKQTSVMAILAYLCFTFFTVICSYDIKDSYFISAYFWDELRDSMFSFFPNAAFIAAGVINAMLSFNFCWSKKQSNVVFSLGMSKTDIYFAKILGGLIPMAITFFVAGLAETISCGVNSGLLNERFLHMALLTCLQFYIVYAFSYILCSAVMSNTGNVVEALLFTAILSVFTMVLQPALEFMFWVFTHGAELYQESVNDYNVTSCTWNWSSPFIVFVNYNYNFMDTYFSPDATTTITLSHWSGVISAGVYSLITLGLGYLGFKKRRNEICGTWGRAKVINEIVAAVTGFYAFYFIAFPVTSSVHGDGNLLTFIVGCIAFLVAYIIFKLVFGHKRKKEFKASLNRFPAYVMGLSAVCLVFVLGFFGYSSKVPDVSDVISVTVTSPTYMFLDDTLSNSSEYALTLQSHKQHYVDAPITLIVTERNYSPYYDDVYPGIHFEKTEDIQKIVDIHKKIIKDGKIKNNGADSVGTGFRITYTLRDGTTYSRFYSETTNDTFNAMLSLSDTEPVKQSINDYLYYDCNFELYQKQLLDDPDDGSDDGTYYYYNNEFATEFHTEGIFNNSKAYKLLVEECYLFPTDMSMGYNMGRIDNEFFRAILADINNMTSEQYFHHSGEDEIGVLSFGLSTSFYMPSYGTEYVPGVEYVEEKVDYDVYYEESGNEESTVGTYQSTSWNLNSYDVNTIVVTKDMKNTIAYLEKHDLMKHFEKKRSINDISSVKIATIGELYGEKQKSNIIPLFYACYWTGEQMNIWLDELENSPLGYFEYRFDNINNDITDKAQIQKLLDDSVVFGVTNGNCRIMEITYTDGSVSTVLIPDGSDSIK